MYIYIYTCIYMMHCWFPWSTLRVIPTAIPCQGIVIDDLKTLLCSLVDSRHEHPTWSVESMDQEDAELTTGHVDFRDLTWSPWSPWSPWSNGMEWFDYLAVHSIWCQSFFLNLGSLGDRKYMPFVARETHQGDTFGSGHEAHIHT